MAVEDRQIDILVLDDDVDLLTSTAELLADVGYRVKGFSDPESALEYAIDQNFAVGLFDFRLGSVKNGLDVVETMQALGSKAVFVLITADAEHSTQVRAANLKLHELLRKPVAPERLIEAVECAMNKATKLAA
jgi:DNA-binding NtrC family response regulator